MGEFTYTRYRHFAPVTSTHDTLDDALHSASLDLEYDGAWPYEIREGDTVLWSNAGGHPLREDTCPLTEAIRKWKAGQGDG